PARFGSSTRPSGRVSAPESTSGVVVALPVSPVSTEGHGVALGTSPIQSTSNTDSVAAPNVMNAKPTALIALMSRAALLATTSDHVTRCSTQSPTAPMLPERLANSVHESLHTRICTLPVAIVPERKRIRANTSYPQRSAEWLKLTPVC